MRATFLMLLVLNIFNSTSLFASGKTPFVVVIDAGHGGKDAGTVENGVKEKDINLAVATRLGQLIESKLKNTEVIYTRTNDTFKLLSERAKIANATGANLFISIHCNSVDANHSSRSTLWGTEVYVRGQSADESNLKAMERENKVVELDPEDKKFFSELNLADEISQNILIAEQRDNLLNSSKFANYVIENLVKEGSLSRGVKPANFYVIRETTMPSVLIELDFLCNPKQAKFLNSEEGQNKMANGIFKAVQQYEKYYRANLGEEIAAQEPKAEKNRSSSSRKKTRTKNADSNQPAYNRPSTMRGRRKEIQNSENETVTVAAQTSVKNKNQDKKETADNKKDNKSKDNKKNSKKEASTKNKKDNKKNSKDKKDIKPENSQATALPASVKTEEIVSQPVEIASTASETASPRRHRRENTGTRSKSSASSHRRRSSAARKRGGAQIEETFIAATGEVAYSNEVTQPQQDNTPAPVKETTDKKDKKKDNNKKKKPTSEPKRRDKNSKDKSRRQTVKQVHQIVLFISSEELKADDPKFKNLEDVASHKEKNMYVYTYGESSDKKEMESQLKKIKSLFPDAYVKTILK